MDAYLTRLEEVTDDYADDPQREAEVGADLGHGLEPVRAQLEDAALLGRVGDGGLRHGLHQGLQRQRRTAGVTGAAACQRIRADREVVLAAARSRWGRAVLVVHGAQPTVARVAPETGSRERISPTSCGVRVRSVRLTSSAIS